MGIFCQSCHLYILHITTHFAHELEIFHVQIHVYKFISESPLQINRSD